MDTKNTSHGQRHSSTGARTALICGATGLVGRGVAKALREQGGWTILCASRSGDGGAEFATGIGVDLLDAEDTRSRLARHPDITHVFYAAYAPRPTRREDVAPNTAMLENVLDALADHPSLKHVVLVWSPARSITAATFPEPESRGRPGCPRPGDHRVAAGTPKNCRYMSSCNSSMWMP